METIDQSLAARHVRGQRPVQGGVEMEGRMARVETTIGHIVKDLTDIKFDIRGLRNYVDERFRQSEAKVDERFREFEAKMDARFNKNEASMRTEFRLVWAGMFAIVGILAKGFHWI